MTKHNILSHYRLIGDHPADLLIQSLVDENGIEYIRSLFPFFSNYKDLSFGNLDPLIQDFLKVNSNLPASFDKKNMIRATDYYRNNQENIGLVLGLYSLPYCYLGADGARVLSFSARLNKDAFKRLVETGNFLKAVLNHDNWSEGKIFAICIKVRLLHASIRYFILKSDRWDMKWGYPINQEDLVGTNLAFSLIVLRGMEKLGLQADDSVKKAYINLWNVIGNLLGVQDDILPENYLAAIKLDKEISKHQFKNSPHGSELTNSLMNAFRSIVPNEFTAELLQEQSRFLLGENYANMLEIKTTTIPKSVLSVYNKTSALMSKIF
ncbi:MAG: DUF2236 domain-containing protein [Saprospiraceae bacterium]|uniref:oxygenase MpaB family protein n=1 Tax=Candidatus Brachybacter algidus TaxID=2982024 RepID=UPI00257CC052|nr:oxygenase MpaB family protein [Candidatus Brachybacter algidus]MBK7604841.1 DUF2236 domain-containing protein [Candidatus Brachybacter algidus]